MCTQGKEDKSSNSSRVLNRISQIPVEHVTQLVFIQMVKFAQENAAALYCKTTVSSMHYASHSVRCHFRKVFISLLDADQVIMDSSRQSDPGLHNDYDGKGFMRLEQNSSKSHIIILDLKPKAIAESRNVLQLKHLLISNCTITYVRIYIYIQMQNYHEIEQAECTSILQILYFNFKASPCTVESEKLIQGYPGLEKFYKSCVSDDNIKEQGKTKEGQLKTQRAVSGFSDGL